MAKRMTDTDKWKKPFFKLLAPSYKLAWLYITDQCDYAGVYDVEFDVLQMRTGISQGEAQVLDALAEKIVVFDSGKKWFIIGFNDFQYGELNPANRVHNAVLNTLDSYKKNKGLVCPIHGAKEKEKEKEKVKDKDKDKNDSFNKKVRHLDYVLLLPSEVETLKEYMGEATMLSLIEELNNYIGSTGRQYKSHYHTLRTWYRKRQPEKLSGTTAIVNGKVKLGHTNLSDVDRSEDKKIADEQKRKRELKNKNDGK